MKFSLRNLPKWALTIFCCGFLFSGYAQPSLFSFEKFLNGKGDTLQYRQLFPDYDTLRKYPLVIFLHGSGERGKDNEAQLKWGVKNFATDENMKLYPSFVIAPQCPENSGWSNFAENKNNTTLSLKKSPSKPMELVIALIGLVAYVMAPQISAQIPAAKPAMDGYVGMVDAGRAWLDATTQGLIASLRGLAGNNAP